MYSESVKQISPFVGCKFDCSYCKPSFQRQAKRQKHRCKKCYDYTPHFHPERLEQSLPRTNNGEFIFACQMGDIACAEPEDIEDIIDWMKKYGDRTFLLQSKDTTVFLYFTWPKNVILGTTMETNRAYLTKEYSKAQSPYHRANHLQELKHSRKFVTVEPILDFDLDWFMKMIRSVSPEFVYVGYDTKNCKLKEPTLLMTKKLMKALREAYGIEVREKTIRKAWWE